ncbi:Lactonase, 7-bladed beta-propeller-domain-containing protein [Lipomyces orientalis]|uniref:Lactonase, 7-bladed beta-propeller-domain-containing protein n=1 Tax=Lipomyces orientalis TaxID=1233043 RepID=A0ACC3TI39_9ASCO
MRTNLFCLTAVMFGTTSVAARLFAASYAGTVTSLALTKPNTTYELSILSETNDCGSSPAWLMLDGKHDVLYCLDEGIGAVNGSLTSFKVLKNGTLTKIEHLETLTGAVQSEMYSAPGVADRQFFAVAHYEGSAVTTYSLDRVKGLFKRSQTFTYELAGPGPVPDRQDAPHPHGVVVDPTGRFVLVPDLGADLVYIFYVDPSTGQLEQLEPLAVTPGSGPRHAVFWTPRGSKGKPKEVYLYLVGELNNSLSAFKVTYSGKTGISFFKSYEGSTYGERVPPVGSKAAEIAISPENNHVVVSNRNDNTFGLGNDSFAVFSCANSFRNVTFLDLYPAYGSFPRQFSINKEDKMVAVALQNSHMVAITRWDKKAGAPGTLLAEKLLDGEIPAVVWDL